jgi:hypothetical protein
MQPVLHCPEIIHSIEATLDEEDSFELVKNFSQVFPFYYHYSVSQHGFKQVLDLATTFSALHSRVKIKISGFEQTINSSIPLDVLRYKMLPDGSYCSLGSSRIANQPSYIVEGALWSNGFYYLTREQDSINILDLHFYVDQYTKTMHRYI